MDSTNITTKSTNALLWVSSCQVAQSCRLSSPCCVSRHPQLRFPFLRNRALPPWSARRQRAGAKQGGPVRELMQTGVYPDCISGYESEKSPMTAHTITRNSKHRNGTSGAEVCSRTLRLILCFSTGGSGTDTSLPGAARTKLEGREASLLPYEANRRSKYVQGVRSKL